MTIKLDEPEGATPLTPDELQGLKVQTISTRGELNQLESENIIQGLTWLARLPKRVDILTDNFARDLHRRLYGDVWTWAGQYRLEEVAAIRPAVERELFLVRKRRTSHPAPVEAVWSWLRSLFK